MSEVEISAEAKQLGLNIVRQAKIESGRAEIAMFEAARAHAAADSRTSVTESDIRTVALLALRQRQSPKLAEFFAQQEAEDANLKGLIGEG